MLVQVSRTILARGRSVAYLVDILPEDILLPADLQAGFTGSVLDLLLRRGVPQLRHSIAEIRAVAATAEVARSLEIQRGDVLLMFSAALVTAEDRVVDHSLSYFLPGYFRFKVVRKVGA
jgi:GntR family transcriptional regulator